MAFALRYSMQSQFLWLGGLALAMVFTAFARIADAQAVVTPETLQQAIRVAEPGAVLTLAGGDYGALTLDGAGQGPIILRSADPGDPARFSTMVLRDVDGITLENLVFDYTFAPDDQHFLRPFQILSSRNVTIRGALFDGDVPRNTTPDRDGFGTAFALGITGSDGITLENSEIRGFLRGVVIGRTRNIIISGNDVHSMRSDGLNFAQVENVAVTDNHIHDFLRSPTSGDHPDMIQFWTNGTTSPSRNIRIADNVLNSGTEPWTQSLFMRNDMVDRGLAGDEMFYRDITIENNVIINAHAHGISVGETDGLVIRNNTVVRNAMSALDIKNISVTEPKINVAERSRNVEILRNVTRAVPNAKGHTDWRISDNILVQDQSRMKPGFYGTVFIDASMIDPYLVSSFAPRPGGPLDGTGIGAPQLAQEL
jgi:parallel beta-helix repeat protein